MVAAPVASHAAGARRAAEAGILRACLSHGRVLEARAVPHPGPARAVRVLGGGEAGPCDQAGVGRASVYGHVGAGVRAGVGEDASVRAGVRQDRAVRVRTRGAAVRRNEVRVRLDCAVRRNGAVLVWRLATARHESHGGEGTEQKSPQTRGLVLHGVLLAFLSILARCTCLEVSYQCAYCLAIKKGSVKGEVGSSPAHDDGKLSVVIKKSPRR